MRLKGVLASVAASVLFALMYWMSPRLAPLDGEQIFGWRALMTLPFTTVLLWATGAHRRLLELGARVRARPVLGLLLLMSAGLLGVQLWLFLWAPLHGKALPVSLGYFMVPIVLVLVGRIQFKERLSGPQKLASLLAALEVGWELWRAGGLAVETWVVCLGYPLYFSLRRRMRTDRLEGHWLDMALLIPPALYFVLRAPSSLGLWREAPHLLMMVPLIGMISAAALALYMAASRWLPMGLFGLLSYVEPVLLAVVALLLGERLPSGQAPMYVGIFAAVAILVAEGAGQVWRERRPRPDR